MAAELFRPGVQTAAGWLVREGAEATQNTTSLAAAADLRAAPITGAVTLMHALTEEVTGMAATTTTTTQGPTGEVVIMDGLTVDGAQGSAGVGAGAERPGMATMDIFSIRTPSMQPPRFWLPG